MSAAAWRATLRLARRDARRARGRSLLVLAMVGLPVLGIATADVLYRTAQLSPEESATRTLGAADAAYASLGTGPIRQYATDGRGFEQLGGGQPAEALPAAQLRALLPAGSTTLVDDSRAATVRVGGRAVGQVGLRELAYTEPLAAGLYAPAAGRPPSAAGEAAVTEGLARRLDLAPGATLALADPAVTVRVTAVVRDASSTRAETVLVPPGSVPAAATGGGERRLLVGLPRPLAWSDVERANAAGVLVTARREVPGAPAPPYGSSVVTTRTVTAAVLVAGMALLEVVLLAGPAFAVGAKRQARQLALLAATGADRRQVRNTVLAGGLVLGGVGALLGALGGTAVAAALTPALERINGTRAGHFDVRPLELVAAMGVGVLTALLAAVVPARAASRQDVVSALTGRRGTVRSSRRTPVLGVLATGVGTVIALYGAGVRDVVVILAGSATAELGLVACTPTLVGAAGRLGRWLPAAPRLALRDAARNRGRTAPAVSAILAAVAGITAVGVYVASQAERDRQVYTPIAPLGDVAVQIPPGAGTGDPTGAATGAATGDPLASAAAALRRTLPVTSVAVVRTVTDLDAAGRPDQARYRSLEVAIPPERLCPLGLLSREPTAAERADARTDPRCTERSGTAGSSWSQPVGGADVLAALAGRPEPAAAAVLARGGLVLADPAAVVDGMVTVTVRDLTGNEVGPALRVPAAVVPGGYFGPQLLSPALASRLRLPVHVAGLAATTSRIPTTGEEDAARAAVTDALGGGTGVGLSVERGFRNNYTLGLLALVAGSALVVVGASAIATGLAAADGRADLATLAAVGAAPRTRRLLAAGQSGVTAALGSGLGLLAGLVPAIAYVRALPAPSGTLFGAVPHYPLVVPWANLALTAVAVPLLAALVAALFTRSRLPLVRRVG